MDINDLNKEQVEEMSEEEIYLTAERLDKTERAELIRKKIIGAIEVRDAGRIYVDDEHNETYPRIHVDSEVIN